MKKPGVSISKKGAIFNILWLLVENPKGLTYFRQIDIKNQLLEEFGIDIDRKTVKDYLDILIEMDLSYKISHESNKGYYVSEKSITNIEMELLYDSIFDNKSIDSKTKNNLLNFITSGCSLEEKNKINVLKIERLNNDNNEISLIENIELIKQAIEEKRSITFEYLNYNRYGELMPDARKYEAIPKKIKYYNGMYFLYNAERFWGNFYCGIKIKYMRNIILGDVHNNPKLDEKLDFSFEVYILYDWSIEFIVDHFSDYQIIRDQNTMKAIIRTPYEYALDWAKKFAPFFIINNDEIKNHVLKDMNILLANKSIHSYKIKSAIVDYHYKHPIDDKLDYETYMTGLYKCIDFNLSNIGYTLNGNDGIKHYSNEINNLYISYLECCSCNRSYANNMVDVVKEECNKLKEYNGDKLIVVFFDDITLYEKQEIINLLSYDPFIEFHDAFSNCNKAYFYKYIVLEIK